VDSGTLGTELGASAGYRWKHWGVSADVGYIRDPGREAGMQKVVTGGISVSFTPDILDFRGK
jgi:hypothetical protein